MGVNVRVSGEVPCPGCGTMVNLNPGSEKKGKDNKAATVDNYFLWIKCIIIAVIAAVLFTVVCQ